MMTTSQIHDFRPSILEITKLIKGSKIAFVVDTSDSMPCNLQLIKAFAIELIDILLCEIGSFLFNVISFSDRYSKLSNVLLPCCKATATLATEWIETLNCDTSANTLLALGSAYIDNEVDCVVMLTDGLMTQKSVDVIKCVCKLSRGRSLHIIHINEESDEDDVIAFLETLAAGTNGTLHSIKHASKCVLSRCILKEEKIYPVANSSSSGSSIASDIEDEESEGIKLLGKSVLAKRNNNGYYYKGTVIKMEPFSGDVVVLFQSSRDKTIQVQQTCLLDEVIVYDSASEEKIYVGDKVLVNVDGQKSFIPASVTKKQYIFDDAVPDDAVTDDAVTKVLEVELYNGEKRSVVRTMAACISVEQYDRVVEYISEREEKKNIKLLETNENDAETNQSYFHNLSKDLLRDKIERQLRESEEFLKSLNVKDKYDKSEDNCKYLDEKTEKKLCDCMLNNCSGTKKCNVEGTFDECSMSDNVAPQFPPHAKPTFSSLYSPCKREKHCRVTEPVSWNTSTKTKGRLNAHSTRNSLNVGCNIVEMSKKHWKGRLTSKEVVPKRPCNERWIIKGNSCAPKAEEYQTTDGVPFPVKTDNRFRRTKSASWTPGAGEAHDYLHHDIIAHRIVDVNRRELQADEKKQEVKKKKRLSTHPSNRGLHEERDHQATENGIMQLEQRDEKIRKQIEERITDEFSKMRVTIEKDEAMREKKRSKQEKQRDFEWEREKKNQDKKHTRVAALKGRRKNHETLQEERAEEVARPQHLDEFHNSHDARVERNRIGKKIEEHQSKINRLKSLRRKTDARFTSLKNENDRNRDMNDYVREQQQQISRASILP